MAPSHLRHRQKARKAAPTPTKPEIGPPKRPKKPDRPLWQKGVQMVVTMATVFGVLKYQSSSATPSVLRPFAGTPLKSLPQFGGRHAEELLWGSYRPGYYFGMRPRHPRSLLAGLMWVDPQRDDPLGNIRHEAQQGDGLARYGWLQHDGRGYGSQQLEDGRYNITTAWAKHLCPECGPGGDWGVSVSVEERRRTRRGEGGDDDDGGSGDDDGGEGGGARAPAHVSLFFYVAAEDGGALRLDPAALAAALRGGASGDAASDAPVVAGSTPPLGDWQLHLRGSGGVLGASYLAAATPHTHNLTQLVRDALLASVRAQHAAGRRQYRLVLPDTAAPGANVAVLQVSGTLPLSLDLSLVAGALRGAAAPGLPARLAAVSGDGLRERLAAGGAAFERRFAAAFGELAAGGGGVAAVARAALANLLGGMGYFHGRSLVRLARRRQGEVVDTTAQLWPAALYTAVPSRSFFPRGFLWDEGFHQLLVARWDAPLSRDALAHWLDLMTARGWVAREQILGQEARARVPDEFVRQSPDAANPPTFFLLLSDMSRRVAAAAQAQRWSEEDRADAELLTAAWPRLRAWYLWFNGSQAGPVPGAYRWRGRDAGGRRELNPKALASGLDDAPRASHPTDDERHLDLRCWMALAARALSTIGSNLGLPRKEVQPFVVEAAWLEDFARLNELHLDEASGEYRDWGSHTEDVELRRPMATLADGRQVAAGDMQRMETGQPPRPQLVPQFGYISLFPLLMNLIPPDSPVLGRQLELLRDPRRLWTDFGLRSLSRSASLYQARNTEHDPPYWRGAVWVNVNFLAVRALARYAAAPGPHAARAAELATELRGNLLSNVVRQYERSGYLWEQYDDATGEGKGSHPFTGWTALVALLADE